MSIAGTYYLRMWLPDPILVHGPLDPADGGPGGPGSPGGGWKSDAKLKAHGRPPEHFFEGDVVLTLEGENGKLKGTADGEPIEGGCYTGDSFFKVTFHAGPGLWEIWARVDAAGDVEGIVSVGHGGGFPNLAYGKRICP